MEREQPADASDFSALERETEHLLRSIQQGHSPGRGTGKTGTNKIFHKRKRSRKTGRKKKLLQQSASEPILGGADRQPEAYFQDDDKQREAPLRDLSFAAEETRVRQGIDSFVPQRNVSQRRLELDKRALYEEIERLEAVEQAQDDEIARIKSNQEEIARRKHWADTDIAANHMQRMYRGHISRRRVQVMQQLGYEMTGWTEVRDEELGERWYYNTITDESCWDPPVLPSSSTRRAPVCNRIEQTTPTAEEIFAQSGREFPQPEFDSASQMSRPSSTSSLPPLGGSSRATSIASSLHEGDDHLLLRPSSSGAKLQKGGKAKQLPPLPAPPQPEGERHSDYCREEQDEVEEPAASEAVDDEGQLMGDATPRLFLPDGSKNISLRATIQDALNVSKYDSVSTLLASGPAPKVKPDPDAGYDTGGRPMVAVMHPLGKKSGTKRAVAKGSVQGSGPPAVHEISDPGFTVSKESLDGQAASVDVDQIIDVSGALKVTKAGHRVKRTREVCFLCWSASRNAKCSLHSDYEGKMIRAEDSALICGNWELDALRRKYRAEEIQEIFMKQSQSLQWDKNRKQFQTVTQMRHPIYKAVAAQVLRENKKLWRKVHVRRWLRSFIDNLRVGKVPGADTKTPMMLRLKNTLTNFKWVQRYTNGVRSGQPRPPITKRIETREVRYCVCIDPSPPHRMLIHGGGEGSADAPRFTRPVELYRPRTYELPAPRSIPMPEPSYAEEPPLPVANTFMDEREKHSWFERMCAVSALVGMQSAMTQVEACTPARNFDKLKRTKYPPPVSIKFANFCRKPKPPDNMAVGGLCAELTITQLVMTYVPPQFGGFTVTDRRAFAPTPNRELIFKTLECPSIMAKYVKRALEHLLNIRKPPTLTCSTCAVYETIKHHPHLAEEEAAGVIDDEGDMVTGDAVLQMFVRHYHGENRPQQTGEDLPHGFRTTVPVTGLPSDSETMALTFTPTVDVATPNLPSTNRSETTHADRHYPFCEPSNRDNTTLDFFHLLLAGKATRNQGQVFTTLGWQDPGLFGMKCDLQGPMGPMNCIVYRSWAFHQESPVEEFLTDDGVPYWYDRKTGETFWERPIIETEVVRGPDGGVDGTIALGEGEVATLGVGVDEAPYPQSDVRKYIVKSLEDEEDVDMRYKALAMHENDNPRPGSVLPPSAPSTAGALEQLPLLGSKPGTSAISTPSAIGGSNGLGATEPPNTPASVAFGNSNRGIMTPSTPAGRNKQSQVALPPSTQTLVTSITNALGNVLQTMGGQTNGQELLQLGLGLGMGLGMKHPSALADLKTASPNGRGKACNAGMSTSRGDSSGGGKLPDIGDLYAGYEPTPTLEDLEKEIGVNGSSDGQKNKVDASLTPDEAPLDAEFLTHKPAGLGTTFVDKPLPGEPSTQHLVPGTDGHLRACKAIIPEGFVQSITATHTASQSVDYLPYFPNLNEAQSVGCVKPRRAAEDWMAIGFDPWSAGKEPLTTQLVLDVSASLGQEVDEKPKGKDGKVLKAADLSGLDDIKEKVTQENKDAHDLEHLETLCRHGKYEEVERCLDDPDWTLPIDAKDDHGNTLLLIAAQNGNKRIAKLALRRGADLNTQNLAGQTCLHYCFAYGYEKMAEYLMQKGADDSLQNADGLTCYEGLNQESVDTL